ncbi:MAG: hypothetical protein JHD16_11225 [Solirubrobacteraceae bacterium]|nr:hypothetical protein [Solirubrobacteraceae bacterium]
MTPRKAPSDEQLREAFSEVHDALQRAVVLSSDRVQSVFEDAVLRGRMTRRDAEELATSLMTLGRDQAQELRGEVDALARSIPARVADVVADATGAVSPAKVKTKAKAKAKTKARAPKSAKAKAGAAPETAKDAVHAEAERLVEQGAPSSLPADAADRPAKELIALAATLPPADLRVLRAQEQAGKARATVLRAIDAKLPG